MSIPTFQRLEEIVANLTPERLRLAEEDLKSSSRISDPDIHFVMKELQSYGQKHPLSNENRMAARNKIKSACWKYGLPNIWFTINPNDLTNPKLADFAGSLDFIHDSVRDPVSSAEYFAREMECFFKHYVHATTFNKDGDLVLKRSNGFINRWNKTLAVGLRHNHDISFLNSTSQSLSMIYYATNYATKLETPILHHGVTRASVCRDTVCPQLLSVVQVDSRVMVFARGTDKDIWYNTASTAAMPSWPEGQQWESLRGGPFVSQPSAISWSVNDTVRVSVTAVSDPEGNALMRQFIAPSSRWDATWQNQLGSFTSPISLCIVEGRRLDGWAIQGGIVRHNYYIKDKDNFLSPAESKEWQDPLGIGETGLVAQPGITCRLHSNVYDVFVYSSSIGATLDR
ncbi:hypothetical protein B0T18DRAFT_428600 [Schizothecium vesticola]|uniref:Fucose-specific lectin n=1 Tax=Schizothecium vesticola TaxID=314040 RepID=A0AA40K4C1_9PEZI|nr:hypothetical protein B0T18DRAFT_428600 [Schizothecium vesticola]